MSVTRIFMRPWQNGDVAERRFDNTKLVALNTCPTWGIVRYEHHRTFLNGGRAMALEAGSASHHAYAAVRLGDMYFHGDKFYGDTIPANVDARYIATARATQLFGEQRTADLLNVWDSGEDAERAIMLGALEIFGSSGYYEDPNDRKRTIANIEEALIAYVSRTPLGVSLPVIIGDFVGVEIGINMYLEIELEDGTVRHFQFVGRVDGIHYKDISKQVIRVEENKTSSRLDDAWRLKFAVDHQPTGYMIAGGALINREIYEAVIRGMAIPLPKSFDYGGIVSEPVSRTSDQFIEWAEWVVHTVDVTAPFLDKPEHAPKYTHSCNRYFRPCPMIPFCDSPLDERRIMFEEMSVQEWNPLEEGNA